MYFIYSVLLSIAFLILLPRFLFDAFRHGKYVAGFRERFGNVKLGPNSSTPLIWIHSVSVGETQAARPLVNELRTRFPDIALAISTTTRTGHHLAREFSKTMQSRSSTSLSTGAGPSVVYSRPSAHQLS